MTEDRFNEIQAKFSAHAKELQERRIDSSQLRAEIGELKSALQENTLISKDLIEVYEGLKSFLKVLSWAERFAVGLVKIAAAIGVIIALWKFVIQESIRNITK